MRRVILTVAALAGAALALGGGDGVASGPTNPHGDPTACTACHAPGATPTEVGAALPIVATCRGCHPTADMHPVGISPNHVKVADGWPLEEGKLTCATCHAEPAHGGDAAALQAPWHRGGPYPNVTRLCYSCHEAESYTRTSPHRPEVGKDPKDTSCAACHSGAPPEGASPEKARLRAGADKACTGSCHSETLHAGAYEHLGKVVEPAVASQLPATMPLHQGAVACYTCHDVHGTTAKGAHSTSALASGLKQRALEEDWRDLATQSVVLPEGDDPHAMLSAPTSDGTLCRACHGAGP